MEPAGQRFTANCASLVSHRVEPSPSLWEVVDLLLPGLVEDTPAPCPETAMFWSRRMEQASQKQGSKHYLPLAQNVDENMKTDGTFASFY